MFVSKNLWFLFFLLAFSFLALLIVSNVKYDEYIRIKYNQLAKEALSTIHFHYDDFHIGDDKLSAIAMNKFDKKLAILYRDSLQDSFHSMLVDFNNIIKSSIVEDGAAIVRASKDSVNIEAEPAIIRNKVKRISLMIAVTNLDNPVYEINFMDTKNPVNKEDPMYKNRKDHAYQWHQFICDIIENNRINVKA